MVKSIFKIIPRSFGKRAIWVAITIFVRALLNFVGIAMLVPILVLMLDRSAVHDNRFFAMLSDSLALDSYQELVFLVCGIVMLIIIIKNLLNNSI